MSHTTLLLQDQELEQKKINKRIKLYKQTFHFLAISDQLMKENLLKSIKLLLTFQLHVY